MLSMGGLLHLAPLGLLPFFGPLMTEEEAGHVICLHTHEHTSITRILAQAKFLKGRAAADLLLYSRWEASSTKRAFEQWPSLPGSESSNCRAVYSPHLPF